jgi:serine/arginine repetitive matrix protein 2
MSSRFNNDRDPRYNPRDRSPPRFPDRRPSGAYNNNAGYPPRPNDYARGDGYNRDIPRGPRGLNDTPTRPAPTGPRGGRGGGFGRGSDTRDFRDTRDGPNFSSDRWRDGEDRWERRTSPRGRSPPRGGRTPPRDRRDDREFPKPIDTDRARLEARDGPPSAGSNLSDPPRNPGPAYRGGGFARGGGRGDFNRRFTDDRNSFRPRSRSRERGPPRERDRSVDSRDMDRRDRARETDDRRFYRDREEVGFFRRDTNSRLDTRPAGDGRPNGNSAQSTPQTERPPMLHISPQDGLQTDSRRPYDGSRRGSALSDGFPNKLPRDERPDLFAGRMSRTGSPPPSAPQVPAFGFRQPTFAGPTSISWKNPDLQVPKPPPASGAAQPFKGPPTAPRALSAIPPTAPKADRVLDRSKLSNETLRVPSEETSKDVPQTARQPPVPPTPLKPTLEVKQPVPAIPSQSIDIPQPSSNKLLAPPSGPRAMTSNAQPFGRSPPIGGPMGGYGRAVSPIPPSTIPTGPRAGAMPTSPRTLPDNVPTGPKADRLAPATPRGPPPKLMRANSSNSIRNSTIPSKRDSDGQERETSPSAFQRQVGSSGLGIFSRPLSSDTVKEEPPRKSPKLDNNSIDTPKPSSTVSPVPTVPTSQIIALTSEDVDMADAPTEAMPQDTHTLSNLTDDDDDDETLDMTELLKEREEKFNADKAKLEAKLIDLSREEFRPSLLLDHVVRLVALQSVVPDLDFKPRSEVLVETRLERKPAVEESTNGSIDTPAELPTPREEEQDVAMADAFQSGNRSVNRSVPWLQLYQIFSSYPSRGTFECLFTSP